MKAGGEKTGIITSLSSRWRGLKLGGGYDGNNHGLFSDDLLYRRLVFGGENFSRGLNGRRQTAPF